MKIPFFHLSLIIIMQHRIGALIVSPSFRGPMPAMRTVTTTTILATDSNTPMDDEVTTTKDKSAGRKKRVILGYKATLISFLALAISCIVQRGFTPFSLFFVTGNLPLPAGVTYIMVSAATNDRLKSDTYKRLNLALLEYGAIGLSTVALVSERRRNPILLLPFLLATINSIKGYTYGVLGWNKRNADTSLIQDFLSGTQTTIKSFFSIPKNVKSFVYLIGTGTVAGVKLTKLMELIRLVQGGATMAELTPSLSRFGRLALLTAILYTLKDAADRDRLEGTTFIQLNYLSALSITAYTVFMSSGVSAPFRALAACFAAFAAWNGISCSLRRETV